jgi:hypothetical protein
MALLSHIYPRQGKLLSNFCDGTMILGRSFCSPAWRQLMAHSATGRNMAAIKPLTARFLTVDPRGFLNLNEDNMMQYQELHSMELPPKQEWDTFRGKVPVLKVNTKEGKTPDNLYGDKPRVSVLMELGDRVGILHEVLKYFWKYDINVSRIESRPFNSGPWGKPKFDFYMDFDGSVEDANVQKLFDDLSPLVDKLLVLDEKDVHWFPRHISELDLICHRTLDAGQDLESDHPGFNDMTYRSRRAELTVSATNHKWDQPIPTIDYTPAETETWGIVWDRMGGLWKKYACKEYMVRTVSI